MMGQTSHQVLIRASLALLFILLVVVFSHLSSVAEGVQDLSRSSFEGFLGSYDTVDFQSGSGGISDAQGYRVVGAPEEASRFEPLMSPGDEGWAEGFSIQGMDDKVTALALDSNGNLYAGGFFATAGGVEAWGVAIWNGISWGSLGSGLDGIVRTIVRDKNGNIYAGGGFTKAGWVTTNYIAKWNGHYWQPLGSGTNGAVMALALDEEGNLYAGGHFTMAGGIAVNNVAKWNGTSWETLGSGVGGDGYRYVNGLMFDGYGNLYAGGYFTMAGGNPANNIAKWNGASWAPLGNGAIGGVSALAADADGNLFANGYFTSAGGSPAYGIFKWNGSTWEGLGSDIGTVEALMFDEHGDLYAGGCFSTAGGNPASNIARWNGSSWQPLGKGIKGREVLALAMDQAGTLYVGGEFSRAGEVVVNNIARWHENTWSGLDNGDNNGLNFSVAALAADGNGNVFAGGDFTVAGGVEVNNVAKWNGSSWEALGSGIEDPYYYLDVANIPVRALAVDGSGKLYAGGEFVKAGGVEVNHVAMWNGSSWQPLGNGTNYSVLALATDGSGNLFAGGVFSKAGGVAANGIAMWNGSSWQPLGEGVSDSGAYAEPSVNALAIDGSGNLYVGGHFDFAGGVAAAHVAMWNGSSWQPLGEGLSRSDGSRTSVTTLAIDGDGNLYAGGQFSHAGGVEVRGIAKWDGTSWKPVGSDIGGTVYSLAHDGGDNLYVGGSFYFAGGVSAHNIARWDGISWKPLGSGVEGGRRGEIICMVVDTWGDLYVGGKFITAGGKRSEGIAKWYKPATVPGAPTGVSATAGNAQATVSFTPPASDGGSPLISYTVKSNPGGFTASGAKSPITLEGLANGTVYNFTVTAANAVGTGPPSNPSNSVTPTAPGTVPGAPREVAATARNAQATVSFKVPASLGGSPITSYTVTSSPDGITASGKGSPITVKGLTNGTTYTFTVTATNAVGTGPASSPSNSVTPATVPGAPAGVAATAGNAQATVSFTPPAFDGGSPIIAYTVRSTPGGITATGASSPITVTGLSNGTAYTFTVKATNAVGTGPVSMKSNKVTPASLAVTSPNGGETWYRGKKYTISWDYAGNPGATVRIELIKGSSSSVITASTSAGANGKGSFSWTIPKKKPAATDYTLRVTSRTKPFCTDISDGTFAIK